MNLSTSSKNVRRLAKQYGMSEGDIREMVAIESGRSQGDVKAIDANSLRLKVRIPIYRRLLSVVGTLFSTSFRSLRSDQINPSVAHPESAVLQDSDARPSDR